VAVTLEHVLKSERIVVTCNLCLWIEEHSFQHFV